MTDEWFLGQSPTSHNFLRGAEYPWKEIFIPISSPLSLLSYMKQNFATPHMNGPVYSHVHICTTSIMFS